MKDLPCILFIFLFIVWLNGVHNKRERTMLAVCSLFVGMSEYYLLVVDEFKADAVNGL